MSKEYFLPQVTNHKKGPKMNHRTAQLKDAVDEAANTMRAASQALTLMEDTAAEGELCGLLARVLSREADRLERKTARQL